MPEPGEPQSLNRFTYAANGPLRYADPSGFDPLDAAWVAAFRAAHGRNPDAQDVRDRLFSLMHPGSGPNGDWTHADWTFYHANRERLWRQADFWPGEPAPSLDRFATHVGRLACHYSPGEEAAFVKAIAFVFGGVPYAAPLLASIDMLAPGDDWAAYPPLYEGDAGWAAELVDDENPAHHYAGFLHTGYFYGPRFAAIMGWFRDGPLSGLSEPDLALGAMAARHASMLGQYFPVSDFDVLIRHSLSVEAYAWPPDRPH